jgi:hypothetical protein
MRLNERHRSYMPGVCPLMNAKVFAIAAAHVTWRK